MTGTRDLADTTSESTRKPWVAKEAASPVLTPSGGAFSFLCLWVVLTFPLHPHRSAQRTGSLTVSTTSSTTTWRTVCPLSLPGASSAFSSRWRGTRDLPAAPSRHCTCSQEGSLLPGRWVLGHGNSSICPLAQSFVQKPQEEGLPKVQVS